MGRTAAWDELSLFLIWTNGRVGRIVAWDELSRNQKFLRLLPHFGSQKREFSETRNANRQVDLQWKTVQSANEISPGKK